MTLACVVCGTEFEKPIRKRGLAKKYCSTRCNVKAWRAADPERAKACSLKAVRAIQAKRAENPEIKRAYDAARYAANRDRERARVAAYRATHREKCNAYSKAWRAANPGKQSAAARRWEAEHPELKAHYQALRYARRKGNGGTHTLEQWQQKCTEYGNRCAYCGKDRPLTRDHVVPVSKGGTDDIANIIPACQLCNSKKRTRTPEEFLRIRAAERSAP